MKSREGLIRLKRFQLEERRRRVAQIEAMIAEFERMAKELNDQVVAEGPMRTQPGKFTLSGDGLCIGHDSGDNVSQDYKAPGTFTGGMILGVAVSVGKQEYLHLEKMAEAAFAVE